MAIRVPTLQPQTLDEMNQWFGQLYSSGLLYHPDDPAETIVRIEDGSRLFSDQEALVLNLAVTRMFAQFGDGVYEAADRYFRHWLHGTRDVARVTT